MKRSNHDPLLKELLADESLEAVWRQSLAQGMAIARRRRQRAHWAKRGVISAMLVAALWLLIPFKQNPSARHEGVRASAATSGVGLATVTPAAEKAVAPVRFISDDELLALFPGRSLALIGPPGQKTLVFLDQSPADDANEAGSSP